MNNTKIYICECGRKFTKPQSYNAHLSHCKIHLDNAGKHDTYVKRQNQVINNCAKGRETQKKQLEDKKQSDLNTWILEQHICECCGKLMTEKYGSGRFCCRSCANRRNESQATKNKISIGVHKHLRNFGIQSEHGNISLKGRYDNFWFDSSYELVYYIYQKEHYINIVRNRKDYFVYIFDNKEHYYFPDFYLVDENKYIEIKGKNQFYNEELVFLKGNAVINSGKNYEIIYDEDIKIYYDYVKEKYNLSSPKSICEYFYNK